MIADPKLPDKKVKRKRGNPRINEVNVATRIKPGEVRNPEGRPKTKTGIRSHVIKYIGFTAAQLKKELKKKELTVVEEAAINHLLELSAGDWQRLKEEFDRDEGKPNQNLNINQNISIIQEVAEMSDDEVNNRIKELASESYN